MNSQLKKNFSFALIAQAISLIVSCMTNLVLPKVLSELDYSYWQLFIFYSTYIPCLALGLNDGVYLRYGGADKETLDYNAVKSQFIFGFIYQFVFAVLIILVAFLFTNDANRRIIFVFVSLYLLVFTTHNYIGYIFQAVNETNIYSKSIIIVRMIYLAVQVVLIITGKADVYILITFYTIAFFGGFLYLYYKIQNRFRIVRFNYKVGKQEAWISIRTGSSLMVSNICSMLVLGVGRQIVDLKWGIVAFGKVSFSLTLINFALTFIAQVSMVLFPALRRLEQGALREFYQKITIGLFLLLPLLYIMYIPGEYILKLWLPNYTESIRYLAIILPICFFDCKMNLIGNTFFKVLSKQVTLLKVNILTIAVSGLWGIISAYIINNMTLVVVGMVIAIMFRSVLADLLLAKHIGVSVLKYEMLDIILGILFIFSANYLNVWVELVVFIGALVFRFIMMRKHICYNDRKIRIMV